MRAWKAGNVALANAPGRDPLARVGRAIAPLLSSRAHAEHHARGNVSFSDGFGSSSLCDKFFRTRWDLVQVRQRQRRDNRPVSATEGKS